MQAKANLKTIGLTAISLLTVISLIIGIVALIRTFTDTDTRIATLAEQTERINESLPKLYDLTGELKGYTDSLEGKVKKLQSDLKEANDSVKALETEFYSKIDWV